MGRKGFTLIELLVVIAIIAILAAILFPVFTAAKAKGQETKCMNNMSQLGKAMLSYSDDYDGSLPCSFDERGWANWTWTWRERLLKSKHLTNKNVLLCAVKNKTPDGRVFSPFSHYGMGVYLFSRNGYTAYPNQSLYVTTCRVATMPLPGKTILLAENNNGDWDTKPWNDDGSGIGSGGFYPYHGNPNNPGGVFLMCDNHAKFMPVEATEATVNGVKWYYWKREKRN